MVSRQDSPHEYARYEATYDPFEPKRRVLIRNNADGFIEVWVDNSCVQLDFVNDRDDSHSGLRVVGRSVESDHGLIPLVAWYENVSGDLAYYCGVPTDTEENGDFISNRHDSLLGQHVIAAYAENVRKTLEPVLPMGGFAGPQLMAEAQMLTHTKRYEARYLRESPVIAGLRSLASGSVHNRS